MLISCCFLLNVFYASKVFDWVSSEAGFQLCVVVGLKKRWLELRNPEVGRNSDVVPKNRGVSQKLIGHE